jgi:ribonuclease BN (tRNA processing enzyme)
LKIKFLGTHNAESKNSKLVTFVIDDILAVEAGSLTSGLTFAEQSKLRWILLSHGHYDHIRDIAALAFNNSGNGSKPPPVVLGLDQTLEIARSHLLDGLIYPEFTSSESYLGKPALSLRTIVPRTEQGLDGYRIKALPVNHPLDAVGFEITSPESDVLFYSGDCGPGLSTLWQETTPRTLIVDTSYPSRMADAAHDAGHLCPQCLMQELENFRQEKSFFPRVFLVHLSPRFEAEIRDEIRRLNGPPDLSIEIASEGQVIEIADRRVPRVA